MSEELICPKCGKELKRKYGLPGLVVVCECGEEYVFSLGKLVQKAEFHRESDEWHGT